MICAIFDLSNVVGFMAFDLAFSLQFSAVASGRLGFCIYAWKLLERATKRYIVHAGPLRVV